MAEKKSLLLKKIQSLFEMRSLGSTRPACCVCRNAACLGKAVTQAEGRDFICSLTKITLNYPVLFCFFKAKCADSDMGYGFVIVQCHTADDSCQITCSGIICIFNFRNKTLPREEKQTLCFRCVIVGMSGKVLAPCLMFQLGLDTGKKSCLFNDVLQRGGWWSVPACFWVPAFHHNQKCFLLSSYLVFVIVCILNLQAKPWSKVFLTVFFPLVFWRKGTEMSFFPLDELTAQIKFQNGILLIFGRLPPLQITVITWVQAFQRQKKKQFQDSLLHSEVLRNQNVAGWCLNPFSALWALVLSPWIILCVPVNWVWEHRDISNHSASFVLWHFYSPHPRNQNQGASVCQIYPAKS